MKRTLTKKLKIIIIFILKDRAGDILCFLNVNKSHKTKPTIN